MIRKPVFLIPVSLSYAVLAWFVYFVVNPLCYNIFQQPAFVLTSDYFWSVANTPGGLSEYLQMFIDQFTMFRFWGTLFLVLELFVTVCLTVRYVRKAVGANIYVSMLAHVLAVGLMCVAWIDVKYAFAINMKALILVSVLNLHQFLESRSWYKFVVPVIAVFVYMAAGAVPLYVFTLCCAIHYFSDKNTQRLVIMCIALAFSALLPYIMYKFILPIDAALAFYQVVPQKYMFITFGFNATQLFILGYIPVVLALGFFGKKKYFEKVPLPISLGLIAIICAGSFLLSKKHDKPTERISYKMEVAAYHKNWNEIIKYVADNPKLCTVKNYDRNINFYYDMALAQKNQLGTKMFTYPQLMGIDALFIDEPMATIVCLPVAMFYYNMGFVTNALHFALEAQTSYPSSHYTMRYVIDCLIVIGDYRTAEKFLDKYEKTMFSGKYVAERRKVIQKREDVTDTDFTSKYIHDTRAKHPTDDFYMQSRQNNVLQILMANPKNQVASQYLICSALLQNDLDLFAQILLAGIADLDYNNLPRIYQEALLLYWSTSQNVRPETEKFKVSSYLRDAFADFARIMTAKSPGYEREIAKKYPNTFWRYYCIDSPVVRGAYVILK